MIGRTRQKNLSVILPVNDRLGEALDYQAFHLGDKWSHYYDEVGPNCRYAGQTAAGPDEIADARLA